MFILEHTYFSFEKLYLYGYIISLLTFTVSILHFYLDITKRVIINIITKNT